jgi:hypothetical protein
MLTNIWQTIKERWLNIRQPKPAEAVIQQVPVTVIGDRPQTPAAPPVETPVQVTQPVVVAAPAPQPVPEPSPLVQQPIAVATPEPAPVVQQPIAVATPEPAPVVQQPVVAAEPALEPIVTTNVKEPVETKAKPKKATKTKTVEKKAPPAVKKTNQRKPKAT